ncbi:hypothetical protein AVEN_181618-1 [Araneus ventricosus]|uniref:Uncharacterized protein n=1 Tax=Araneus ventricosus TaxID=182803 RepID=A0A4Y2CLF8_ARAVE|nr:hypothetical protein AVEN_181618-1 [Araneus ventricosus]
MNTIEKIGETIRKFPYSITTVHFHFHNPRRSAHPLGLEPTKDENYIDSGAKAIYADGSKTDEGTGSAYCILENYGIIAPWQGTVPADKTLFAGTVPADKTLFAGTIPTNNSLFAGTVPADKTLFAGTVPVDKTLFAGTVPADKTLFADYALADVHLDRYQNEGDAFLQRIVAIDETWERVYNSELKRQSNEWHHPSPPRPQKVQQEHSRVKVMLIVAYDCQGVILTHAVPEGQTVNADYYCRFPQHHLLPAMRRKRSRLLRDNLVACQGSLSCNKCHERNTGRLVHNILPKVSLSPINWGRADVLFFTGHGPFQSCLKRFHLSPTWNCSCGQEGSRIYYATECLLTTS